MRALCITLLALVLTSSLVVAGDNEHEGLVAATKMGGENLGALLRADRKKVESAMKAMAAASAKGCDAAFIAAAFADIEGLERVRKPARDGDAYKNLLAYYLMHTRPYADDRAALDCWLGVSGDTVRVAASHLRAYRLDAGTLLKLRQALEKGGLSEDHASYGLEILNAQFGLSEASLDEIAEKWDALIPAVKAGDSEFASLNKRKAFRLQNTVEVGYAFQFAVHPDGSAVAGVERNAEGWALVRYDTRSGKRSGEFQFFRTDKDLGTVPSPRYTADGKHIVLWGQRLQVIKADDLSPLRAEAFPPGEGGWNLSGDNLHFYRVVDGKLETRSVLSGEPGHEIPFAGSATGAVFSPNLAFAARPLALKSWELVDLSTGKVLRQFSTEVEKASALTNDGASMIAYRGHEYGYHTVSTTTGAWSILHADNFAAWVSQNPQGKVSLLQWKQEAIVVTHTASGRILGVAPYPEEADSSLVGASADGRVVVFLKSEDGSAFAKGRATGDSEAGSKPGFRIEFWHAG
jgi:hypothetical protein